MDFVKFLSDKKDINDYYEQLESEKNSYKTEIWQGEFPFKELGKIMETDSSFCYLG